MTMKKKNSILSGSLLFSSLLCLSLIFLATDSVQAGGVASGYIYLNEGRQLTPLGDVLVTDGYDFVRTDESGRYELELQDEARWVAFVNPGGTMPTENLYELLPDDRDLIDGIDFDFTVEPLPHDPGKPFRFVHHSDLHFSSEAQIERCYNTIVRHVHRMPETPAFVIDSGDVSNDTRQRMEWARMMFDRYELPWFVVKGNHDQDSQDEFRGQSMEQLFQPLYFAFTYDGYLFVNFPWSAFANQAVDWAEKLLEQIGEDYHIVVNQHHWWGVGRRRISDLINLLQDYNAVGALSGHYHSNQVMAINGLASFSVTSADGYSRDLAMPSFNIITAYPDGKLVADYRNAGFEQHLDLISPADNAPLRRDKALPVQVNAYDTALNVEHIKVEIRDLQSGRELESVSLENNGGHAWAASITARRDWPDEVVVFIQATDETGDTWQLQRHVQVSDPDGMANPEPAGDWGMYQGNPGRAGARDGNISPPLQPAWIYINRNFGLSSPIVAGGRVFAGIMNNQTATEPFPTIVALDFESGRELWSHEVTGSSVRNTLAADGQRLVAQLCDGKIICLDAATGDRLWEDDYMVRNFDRKYHPAGLSFNQIFLRGSPMIADGVAYFGLRNAYAAAANLQNGEFLWRRIPSRGSRSWANASWAKSEDYLFMPAGRFQALDPETADQVWETDVARAGEATPVYRGNRVFYANPYNRPEWAVHAMDAQSGEVLWQTIMEDKQAYYHMSSPAVGDQCVYFSIGGTLFALNKENGEVVWRTDEPGATEVSPVIAGDYVYLVNRGGRLFALTSDTGDVRWHFDLGVNVSSGMALSGNTLFITGRNGALYAFVPITDQ